MKAISENSIDRFEEVALKGADQIEAFFTYQGNNAAYLHKAKIGAATISAYARIRASETNRISLELAAKRAGK